jgi:hypothetical protein
MIILSYGKDTICVASSSWIYSYHGMNPYQIRKVLAYVKHEASGEAWKILKSYPFEKEAVSGYLQRQVCRHETSVSVQAVS